MADVRRVVIVGGGAAGFFAAIACAEKLRGRGSVTVYEATAHPLAKVRVSGGGRCNVTHACFEPRELIKRYPRGGRELLGAFHRFQPRDTVAWFEARGVELKTEPDGRMFPVTDDSATIIDCLRRAAQEAGVQVITSLGVRSVEAIGASARPATGRDEVAPEHGRDARATRGFWLTLTDGTNVRCERLLIATGGNRPSAGLEIAQRLGHAIEPPVPSLFTFHIDDKRLVGLSGVAVERAAVAVKGTKLKEEGALLITHWGLSGPAVLKLSAWGARALADVGYDFPLLVNFAAPHTRESLSSELARVRAANPKKHIATWSPLPMPQRLWERLVVSAGIAAATPWAQIGNAALGQLTAMLVAAEFAVVGKSLFKEEFVTCGGVRLSEVDFKTMESRVCAGLHFAGEVLDVDGVTGGFNFQAAWTTGWLAGQAMAGE
ncbi:NAD(P)/FAD-dependent oxidoreductase [Opitutus terrae]|uniref:HI0933 family protein n=1 Tax=Opitutus terrae (strain DSM 11246 / JCM 15787 / PB90-1) TaxID=452637 RepID=B1ZSU3_OPITP|nr:NAD(P)/FAD-dependent oxidoreductase [Opitutus terrae]ACB74787.1 HI0933 family protein [Opitutus terrae PB90-1]